MTQMLTPSAKPSLDALKSLGAQLRLDSIRCTTAAGSGHPTSSMSAADLMAVLMVDHLRYDWNNPHHPNNDRLIFSKGHACPLLYSMYKAAGVISDAELLRLRKMGGILQGHPNPHVLKWVDVATGSLGQGIANGVGMALNGKYVDKLPYRVWVPRRLAVRCRRQEINHRIADPVLYAVVKPSHPCYPWSHLVTDSTDQYRNYRQYRHKLCG